MYKYTVKVDGMMCGMCESHVNDVIRRKFDIKKVSSSHSKGETVIICEHELSKEDIRETIASTGYDVGDITCDANVKKGLFGWK